MKGMYVLHQKFQRNVKINYKTEKIAKGYSNMNKSINNIKILPVKYPEITSYPHHANLLSILSNNQEHLAWFYNHYFQLAIRESQDKGLDFYKRLDFYIGYGVFTLIKNCPFIADHGLSIDLIRMKWDHIVDFMIDSINCGYYIYFLIDEFYISAYQNALMKQHFFHDIMIFEY